MRHIEQSVASGQSATADPRVFFVFANDATGDRRLYRLTLGAGGSVADLAYVPAVQPSSVFFAASPDGTRVAFAGTGTVPGPGDGSARQGPVSIDVVTVASGERVSFTANTPAHISGLSWDAAGRLLAFQLDGSDGSDGIRILDTAAGGDLISGSRQVLGWRTAPEGEYTSPVLSPDGGRVYAIAARQDADGARVTQVVELDAYTGAQPRVLFERPYTNQGNAIWAFTQLTRDPLRRQLLVVDGDGSCFRIDIAAATATRFPFPPGGESELDRLVTCVGVAVGRRLRVGLAHQDQHPAARGDDPFTRHRRQASHLAGPDEPQLPAVGVEQHQVLHQQAEPADRLVALGPCRLGPRQQVVHRQLVNGHEHVLLARDVVVQARHREVGAPGDVAGGRAVVADLDEGVERRGEGAPRSRGS